MDTVANRVFEIAQEAFEGVPVVCCGTVHHCGEEVGGQVDVGACRIRNVTELSDELSVERVLGVRERRVEGGRGCDFR